MPIDWWQMCSYCLQERGPLKHFNYLQDKIAIQAPLSSVLVSGASDKSYQMIYIVIICAVSNILNMKSVHMAMYLICLSNPEIMY